MLKKAAKFEWADKCERAFQELRKGLITAPILTLSVEGKEYTIHNDMSKNGFGYVMMQEGKIIAYASGR